MDILRVHVDDASQTILKMDRASIMEYMKRVPGLRGATPTEGSPQSKPTKADIDKKIEQLDQLKQALQKEEVELEKQEAAEKATKAKAAAPKKSKR
jgi:hypothetical protein